MGEGIIERAQMASPQLSIMGIFTRILFDFNNEEIIIELPENAGDVERVDCLDANDLARIRIERYCRLYIYIFL